MSPKNQTMVVEFLLLGFQNFPSSGCSFFLLLLVYLGTVLGNLTIICLVALSSNLHTPMYLFLTQLSISDILMITDIVPNTLKIVLRGGGTLSFIGCMIQLYFFGGAECSQCLFLTVMAYDRYLAICSPLHYSAIMNYSLILKLISMSWVIGLSSTTLTIVTISTFQFCRSNVIDHFFCDLIPLLDISCSDTFIIQVENFILLVPLTIIPIIIIVISYTNIVLAIVRISSTGGRYKTFTTCSSHLSVVCIFYGTLTGIYIFPNRLSISTTKMLSLFYTVGTPMLNPIIYSLRNKDIHEAIKTLYSIVN